MDNKPVEPQEDPRGYAYRFVVVDNRNCRGVHDGILRAARTRPRNLSHIGTPRRHAKLYLGCSARVTASATNPRGRPLGARARRTERSRPAPHYVTPIPALRELR